MNFVTANETISSSLQALDSIQAHRQANRASLAISGSKWKGDSELKKNIAALQAAAKSISDTSTKFQLVVSTGPSAEELGSILNELVDGVQAATVHFLNTTSCSCSSQLFDVIYKSTRFLIYHVQQLTEVLERKEFKLSKSATGMVWKAAKNVAELPISNKAALRRAWMADMNVLKDTVREFSEYSAQFKAKEASGTTSSGGSGGSEVAVEGEGVDEDEEEDDDEEEEQEYTAEEVVVVDGVVELFQVSLEALKFGLQAITAAADCVDREVDGSCGDGVSAAAELEAQCRSWVASLVDMTDMLTNAVTDLGAELYPPVDISSMEQRQAELKLLLQTLLHMLTQGASAEFIPLETRREIEEIKRKFLV